MTAAFPRPSTLRDTSTATLRDVARLRMLRNAVIGSRTRKSEIVAQGLVPGLVAVLTDLTSTEEMVGLAATIIGSLAHAAAPPTLLSLCRAQATEALFHSLVRLASDISYRMSAQEDAQRMDQDFIASLLKEQLKLTETLLRALRAVLMGLADEVSPGARRERAAGLPAKVGNERTGFGRIATTGQSAREVVGWHMADAGFTSNGETSTGVLASSRSYDKEGALSPREELTLMARKAISDVFLPDHMGVWLGALFIAKLPVKSKVSRASEPPAMTGQSRTSTRPTSPTNASGTSPSPRRMSFTSDTSRMTASLYGTSTLPAATSSAQARVLAIVEMVAGILSSCLAVTTEASDAGLTPVQVVTKRRRAVLAFTVADSPYRSATRNSGMAAGEEQRGRGLASVPDSEPMQASFVKRGKSIDGRNMDEKERHDAVLQQQLLEKGSQIAVAATGAMAPDTGVLQVLLEAVECGYAKTQEAALWALTDLARENTDTSRKLFSCTTPSGKIPTSMLLNLRKEASPQIRLAAFSCLANIIKAHPFTPRTNECVLSVLVELIEVPGEIQVSATFALARLLADDADLQMLASDDYGCVEKLGALLAKNKADKASEVSVGAVTHDGVSPIATKEGMADRLREATLTALASLCFQRDDIRRKFADHTSPSLLPLVVQSLSAHAVGVRIAACRLVRALSRSISILRTSLVDAGVAARLIAILQDDNEDAEVRTEAVASICNLVVKFSPMKQLLLEGNGLARLAAMVKSPDSDGPTRLNALWAIKNILYSSELSLKVEVMNAVGCGHLRTLCLSDDADIQEQALNIVRNLSNSREEDIEATFHGFGGGESLLDLVEDAIWNSSGDAALEQAAFILVNIAAGNDDHRRAIIGRANLLDALVFLLNKPRTQIRVAGIWTAFNLTQPTRTPHVAMEAVTRLRSFGFDRRLKELMTDPERDVSDRAAALIVRFE